MVILTNQADLQKIPISFKHRGELVPDNIDGHLNIQVPISKIGQFIQNIREEHESNNLTSVCDISRSFDTSG